jgi:hypothetical protein
MTYRMADKGKPFIFLLFFGVGHKMPPSIKIHQFALVVKGDIMKKKGKDY